MERVRSLSSKIEQKLAKKSQEDEKFDDLSIEELQDMNKILKFADFLLCKYEEKKEFRSIIQEFVSMINDSAESVGILDDEISELMINAEDSVKRVKNLHADISEKYDIEKQSKTTVQITNEA